MYVSYRDEYSPDCSDDRARIPVNIERVVWAGTRRQLRRTPHCQRRVSALVDSYDTRSIVRCMDVVRRRTLQPGTRRWVCALA
jgi:hypothetical protein